MLLGQEIYTFFNKYGIKGLIGLVFSMLLICIIIYKTFKISLNKKQKTYQDFLRNMMPQKLKNNKILVDTISNIINLFLLISFNIMVAGFATYFFQELSFPKIIGGVVISIASFITFYKGINGVIKINTYLIPSLILLIIFLGIKKIETVEIIELNSESLYWIVSGILYASYNSITLIPILISLREEVKNKKEARIISTLTFIIMSVLSISIYLLMNTFSSEIKNIELPIVYIANTLGNFGKYIYGIVILIAIFTTAVSAGYGFLVNTTKSRKTYLKLAGIICLMAIFVGQISFSNLISILYPIFGYLGIIQIIFLLMA